MYRDPKKIRNREVKIRFNEIEDDVIESICNYNGEQKAVFVREAVLAHIREHLASHSIKNKSA
jgi:hypothetical protein